MFYFNINVFEKVKKKKQNKKKPRLIVLEGRVFANSPRDLASVPGRVIPKTQKMVLDTSLLNCQKYKLCIKGKVEQSR